MSLHFIFSMVGSAVVIGLFIWCRLSINKLQRTLEEQKAEASDLEAKGDFAGAIRAWKEVLPFVGEQQPHYRFTTKTIRSFYQIVPVASIVLCTRVKLAQI